MADKSPRQNMSKKSSKSLKEKRRDKRDKGGEASGMEKLTANTKHQGGHR